MDMLLVFFIVESWLVDFRIGTDTWFWDRCLLDFPVVPFIVFEIFSTLGPSSVRNAEICACWSQNSMNFRNHPPNVLNCSITTDHGIQKGLIDDHVKAGTLKLQVSNIHLCEPQLWVFLLVFILHQLDGGVAHVDAHNIIISIINNFFGHSR